MRLAVIVPCVRIDNYFAQAIMSLAKNDCARDIVARVVIDGRMPQELPALPRLPFEVEFLATGARYGSAHASNVGLQGVDLDYVGRLDSDDISLSNRIDQQIDLMDSDTSIALTGGAGVMIDQSGRQLGPMPRWPEGDCRSALLSGTRIVHSSLIMRNSVFQSINGYNGNLWRAQDYDLELRAAGHGKVWYLENPLIEYRIHGQQTGSVRAQAWQTLRTLRTSKLELNRVIAAHPRLWLESHHMVWSAAQIARFVGLRRPRYMRGLA